MIIGVFLKHIKAYKGISFIPIGSKYGFVSYVGENGVGKSSILEALNSFFNDKPYPINKDGKRDGLTTAGNEPFISPIFLIKKTKVPRQKKEFEKISKYFWEVQKNTLHSGVRGSMNDFFEIRSQLLEQKGISIDSHYLIVAGESEIQSNVPRLYFASFHGEESFLSYMLDEEKVNSDPHEKRETTSNRKEKLSKLLSNSDWKKFHGELKGLYSFIYFPVEIEVESFTKIETTEMQKVFDKKLKAEIEKSLNTVNFNNQGGINKTLGNFVSEIEVILEKEYCYHTGQDRNNSVTKADLVNKILEVYFQKRVLHRRSGDSLTKVNELSAGEKRQALINLVYAFLKRNSERDRMVIIGIDEPENSLHTSLCYEQFEKLKEISTSNQILVTTHWYGFLPIISKGHSHFLTQVDKKILFESFDLYDYRSQLKKEIEASRNTLPKDCTLKSTYDLVQSIFYSLKMSTPYNWIVCEGVSEKIYFESFFKEEIENKNLRILPMGGQSKVIRLYKYLEIPMAEENTNGKVFCLIDTDNTRCEEINAGSKTLKIRRLSNKGEIEKTHLLPLVHSDTYKTDIEQALNPIIFSITLKTMQATEDLRDIQAINRNGNTDFIKNLKNLKLEEFFHSNDGENKIIFAEKYIEASTNYEEDFDGADVTPEWIKEIKQFFQ
ncbi:hypothetical protein CK910_13450 [Aeromonas sp. CA23]|uniref:ATP-dependent nuclease n=1 Tax=Aeromonas sp. CA23 TaxID=2033032 RepID=UPI000BFD526E|nr:AAA family ATPase [Aeromonas sp. CA23]ATL99369.1 hypothetical protein CK910_13450 [Aeromonas sp. CA23]